MKTTNNKTEQFNIQFLGMKFNCTNPGKKTIVILIMLLIFFLAMVILLKVYVLPGTATIAGAKGLNTLKRWFGGRSL